MTTCSICLGEVRETRQNIPIRCGHLFHSHCLQVWKDTGKNTCPTCRKVFDTNKFKVTVTVQNNHTDVSNTVSLNEESIFNVIDLFDITFDVNDSLDLDSLFSDLGVSLSDFNPSIFDTE